jgi:hypothetical protein
MNNRINLPFEQLKRNLIAIINNYISYRLSWSTFDKELTEDRLALAQLTITEISKKNTYDELTDLIQKKQLANADLSNKYRKQHGNHFQWSNFFSLETDSTLANAYHKVLEEIEINRPYHSLTITLTN